MSVSVKDCLNCITLRDVRVLGGKKGLHRGVTTVSVMEYPDPSLLTGEVIIGNEIVLTAFSQIKDDPQKQVRVLQHLNWMGTSALVLFYEGVFIPQISQELIQAANELDFPLLATPAGRMDFRYGDVIADVMELVIRDREKEQYIVSDMLNQISILPLQNKTIQAVLQLIADRLHCSLILADRYLSQRGGVSWPHSVQWDYQKILSIIKDSNIRVEESSELIVDDIPVKVWYLPVEAKEYHSLRLFALDQQNTVQFNMLEQATAVITAFLNLWGWGQSTEGTDALIAAVLSDNPAEMIRIASALNIRVDSIHTMYIFKMEPAEGELHTEINQISSIAGKIRTELSERHRLVLVDGYEDSLVAFCDDPRLDVEWSTFYRTFADNLGIDRKCLKCCVYTALENTTQAREAYVQFCENYRVLCAVYPHRTFFTESEVRFVRDCVKIIGEGEEHLAELLHPLNRILQTADGEALLDTLSCYLLDAEQNTAETGNYQFLHRNTIHYRLNKIWSILGADLHSLPVALELYRAVAIKRVLTYLKK